MRKGVVCVVLLGVLGALGVQARDARVTFLGPPVVGSRRVEWVWAADSTDPVYTGNSTLKQIGPIGTGPIHSPGVRIQEILLDPAGETGISFSEDGQEIFRWQFPAGIVTDTLAPVPGTARITAAALHPDEISAAVALDDGGVAVWDLAQPDTLWTFQAHPGTCHDLLYIPGTSLNRIVTAGADGNVLEWNVRLRPGEPEPVPEDTLFTFPAGHEARALAVSVSAQLKVVVSGSSLGQIRVYNIDRDFVTSILRDLEPNPIEEIVIGASRKPMATVDRLGGGPRLTIWNFADFSIRNQYTPPAGDAGVRIAFTPPDDLLLIASYEDGRLEVRDGETGQVYRSGREALPTPGLAPHPDGSQVVLGDIDGHLTLWRAGFCRPSRNDPVCFGGYKVWRGLRPIRRSAAGDGMVLLRTYSYGDSSWTFPGRDTLRYFLDPDSVSRRGMGLEGPVAGPVNGFPYYYAVTLFNRVFESGGIFDVNDCGRDSVDSDTCVIRSIYRDPETGEMVPIVPRRDPRTESPTLGKVWVVPNPYIKGQVNWDAYVGFAHVRFVNLPADASIRIYTLAGDLVRVIEHGPDRLGQPSGEEIWDLRNGAGELVTSGIYYWTVQTPEGKSARGYFSVIL